MNTNSQSKNKNLTAGDFTGLAKNYGLYRPDYSQTVLNALLALTNPLTIADVGAGTGIWTRMIANSAKNSTIFAVEPNDDMRNQGQQDSQNLPISWKCGSGENTGLESDSCDWLTMALSFHWTDFAKSTAEFHRVLKNNAWFTALWNPRLIEVNPLLVEIENYLHQLQPTLKRISSGRSGITATLTQQLQDCSLFSEVIYMEAQHVIEMSVERYLGVWNSVNDIQVQLGQEKFAEFINFIREKTKNLSTIQATYLTRAWSARVKK